MFVGQLYLEVNLEVVGLREVKGRAREELEASDLQSD